MRWISLVCIRPASMVTDAPEILFARMDLKEVMEKVEAMRAAEKAAQPAAEEVKEEEPVIDIEPKAEIDV